MSTKVDVIVFGASGYSGKRVLQELVIIISKEYNNITWGIAGRSLKKLQDLLKELQSVMGKTFEVPIILADTENERSLRNMASKTRLLINCTGPYKFHGESVVRACIQENCHYVDIAGEPQFMERMQLIYNEKAAEKGVYVVTSCGIENIPTDMGLDFLQKNFNGTLNSAEIYIEILPENNFGAGPVVKNGSWKSVIHVLTDYHQLREIRKDLFETQLPPLKPKLSVRRYMHKIPLSANYAGPYPSGDATVMRRSQRYFYETDKTRPIQVHTYAGLEKWWHYWAFFVGFFALRFMCLFRFTAELLLKYPAFFTLGFCGDDPDEEDTAKVKFLMTFYGRGWKGKEVDEKYDQPEDSWIVAQVRGHDPYRITGLCAAASALTLLDERQKLPTKGGVFTTASIFTKSSLIDLLKRNGLDFDIQKEGDF